MDATQLRFILQELHFSSPLPPDVLDFLGAESSLQYYLAGETLFREGDAIGQFYLIVKGRLALEMSVPGRGLVRILTLGPGEMVGWSSLLGTNGMTTSAITLSACELIVCPSHKLRQLCDANHDFGYHLMQRMADALSKRLVATRLQLLDLFADTHAPR